MAQESRDNSVLFSLRELRKIEEDRITEEQDAKRREEEDRVRAQQDAERRRREEEEARIRAQQDEERRRQDEIERVQRDEQLRLQETEVRARIEAQAVLEQQRLAEEMRLREQEIAKKRPTWLIATVAVLLLGGSGLGFFLYKNSQENKRQAAIAAQVAAEKDRELAEANKRIAKLEAEISAAEGETEAARQALAAAQTEAEKIAARARLDASNQKLSELRKRKTGSGGSGGAKTDSKGTVTLSKECLDNPLSPKCL